MIENIGAYSQVDYDRGYQQGRADVLREHREQCNGKCLKCEVSVPFVNSDGEEVILPYSYSYKTDCEDNRYINAKEVLSLIKQARADTIEECIKTVKDYFCKLLDEHEEWEIDSIDDFALIPNKNICKALRQLKEQNK